MSTPEAYGDQVEGIEAPEADAIDRTDVDPDTVEADLADVSDQLRVEPIDSDV